jgi:hypothetical protein
VPVRAREAITLHDLQHRDLPELFATAAAHETIYELLLG